MFFDKYNVFYDTSNTGAVSSRLNARHEAIIMNNISHIRGKSVLDIASHDGRWSFAALKAGASYVRGVEPRLHLVEKANSTFEFYGINKSNYDFICQDFFKYKNDKKFDVVFCLVFFYHTLRQAELLNIIDRIQAKFVIIDTEIIPNSKKESLSSHSNQDSRLIFDNPFQVQLLREPVNLEQMAFTDEITRNGYTLVSRPSRFAVEYLTNHYEYSCINYNWIGFLKSNLFDIDCLRDYYEGWRDTFYLEKL